MRGEFIAVWSETQGEIWNQLDSDENTPADLYCELYRALTDALKQKPTVEALADIIDDPTQSKDAFQKVKAADLAGERALVAFLESAYDIFYDLGADVAANHYFNLLHAFVNKFSLRYDLRRPCMLCPTLPGVFTSLAACRT
jgi:hypothetical protein